MRESRLDLETFRHALRQPLPGREAQLTMAVRPRPGDVTQLPEPCPREAAVLLLLYVRHAQWVLPLTRRTDHLELHSGQISLPGGAREPQDQDFAATARRETCEELGIPGQDVEILGALTPLYVPPSRFCVYPHIGCLPSPPVLRPDPREVASVLEVPLQQLLDPSTRSEKVHWRGDERFEVPVYQIGSDQIWGATAMILGEFVWVLGTALAVARSSTETGD
jgi:8-oxo-dGTP pyrophosphatase MutT (NUDIX family)